MLPVSAPRPIVPSTNVPLHARPNPAAKWIRLAAGVVIVGGAAWLFFHSRNSRAPAVSGIVPPGAPAATTPDSTPAPIPSPVAVEPGRVRLTDLPRGAQVRADGEIRTLADNILVLEPGDHTIEVSAAGFQTASRDISLASGQELAWSPALTRVPDPVGPAAQPNDAGQRTSAARPPPVNSATSSAAVRDQTSRLDSAPTPPAAAPIGFSASSDARIREFAHAIESHDLNRIRQRVTVSLLQEFQRVLDQAGSAPLSVTVGDIAPDSTARRASFLMRVSANGRGLLLAEFVADFQPLNGAWLLISVDKRQGGDAPN